MASDNNDLSTSIVTYISNQLTPLLLQLQTVSLAFLSSTSLR